ncbi:MAG: DUF1015 domain-containing protein [Nitrospirota bacterium]
MADIIGFKGILYNKERISDLRDVVSPPYDIISKDEQDIYYQRNDNNVVRLELGKELPADNKEENRYTRAAEYLKEWLEKGILKRDDVPSIYLYELEYRLSSGERKRLKGFFSLMLLEEFNSGKIIPHEDTFSSHKKDRLNLLRVCSANFSPIFSLYSDPEGEIIGLLSNEIDYNMPEIDIVDDEGIRHRVWTISNQRVIGCLTNKMKDKTLFIADGHHRYETALNFRNEMRERLQKNDTKEGFDYTLMFLSNMDDKGLTILPTHRIVTMPCKLDMNSFINKLSNYFNVKSYNLIPSSNSLFIKGEHGGLTKAGTSEFPPLTKGDREDFQRDFLHTIKKDGKNNITIGMCCEKDRYYLLTLQEGDIDIQNKRSSAWNRLDVSIFQTLIIEKILKIDDPIKENHISYIKGEKEVFREIRKNSGSIAFFLNPPMIKELKEVVDAGERMPHKSTYFYPKPLTGLVMNRF